MTPKQKAKELALTFCSPSDVVKPNIASIRSAMKCCDEIMSENHMLDDFKIELTGKLVRRFYYWEEVKEELNSLKI
jgi:hypothetical protein